MLLLRRLVIILIIIAIILAGFVIAELVEEGRLSKGDKEHYKDEEPYKPVLEPFESTIIKNKRFIKSLKVNNSNKLVCCHLYPWKNDLETDLRGTSDQIFNIKEEVIYLIKKYKNDDELYKIGSKEYDKLSNQEQKIIKFVVNDYDFEQIKYYGEFFYLLKLTQEKKYNESYEYSKALIEKNNLKSKNNTISESEMGSTYFKKQSLINEIFLIMYFSKAKLNNLDYIQGKILAEKFYHEERSKLIDNIGIFKIDDPTIKLFENIGENIQIEE